MLKINYRIVDDFNVLKSISSNIFNSEYSHITGFIEILFGSHNEDCYYHENPLQEGETGGELLDWWLNLAIDVINCLPEKKYVAFQEPETFNRWLEFKLEGDNVIIDIAIDKTENNDKSFITEPYNEFRYVEPTNFSVKFSQFKNEVISTANRFITELESINPELLKTKMVAELLNKLKS